MQSRLIDGLEWDLDEDGSGGLCNVHGDKVHLRQGDMDGACGPTAWSWRCWSAANCAGARPRAWSGSTVAVATGA